MNKCVLVWFTVFFYKIITLWTQIQTPLGFMGTKLENQFCPFSRLLGKVFLNKGLGRWAFWDTWTNGAALWDTWTIWETWANAKKKPRHGLSYISTCPWRAAKISGSTWLLSPRHNYTTTMPGNSEESLDEDIKKWAIKVIVTITNVQR